MEQTMENLELRVRKLEKKYNFLKNSVLFLMFFAAYAGVTGTAKIDFPAFAQQKSGAGKAEAEQQKAKEEAGIPVVVEAEVFLLKDAKGNVRGIWTADDDTTSFAMMHLDKYPIIAMAVDSKNASLSLTDTYSGKISLGLTDSIRSFSIMDDTKKNNIYLGLTGTGEAAFDMVSTGNAAVAIDGSTSSLDMSGDTAILALTETVGSTVALKAQPSTAGMTFLDYQNKRTLEMATIDGQTQLYMNSPIVKEEKVYDTKKQEVLSFENKVVAQDNGTVVPAQQESVAKGAADEKAEPKKKEENKIVNMKTYSPFAK